MACRERRFLAITDPSATVDMCCGCLEWQDGSWWTVNESEVKSACDASLGNMFWEICERHQFSDAERAQISGVPDMCPYIKQYDRASERDA